METRSAKQRKSAFERTSLLIGAWQALTIAACTRRGEKEIQRTLKAAGLEGKGEGEGEEGGEADDEEETMSKDK